MHNVTPSWVQSNDKTVEQLIVVYMASLNSRNYQKKTLMNKCAILRRFNEKFGKQRVSLITPKLLQSFIRSYSDLGLHSAAQTAHGVISDLFREAWLEGWVLFSPALPLRAPANMIMRSRLDVDSWKIIYDVAQNLRRAYMPFAMKLALTTGQRRGDIAKMRRCNIHDGHLHILQQKTGYKLALPLELESPVIGQTLGEIIEQCPGRDFLLGDREVHAFSLSIGFRIARNRALPDAWEHPPSFHEQRSLSERIYRNMNIDTQRLLGHRNPAMANKYNNDRGLEWNRLKL